MHNINETLCEAFDIIATQKIQSLPFDHTIQCQIIEDNQDGSYKVSHGSSKFIAYSSSIDLKYKVKQWVYVTIPQNDYSQQKMITGVLKEENDVPIGYMKPFDYFLETSGNLVQNKPTLIVYPNSKEQFSQDSHTTILANGSQGYNMLGITAQFRTNILKEHQIIKGEYGIRVRLLASVNNDNTESNSDTIAYILHTNNAPSEYPDAIELVQNKKYLILNKPLPENRDNVSEVAVFEFKLSSKDFIGNPYNFFIMSNKQEQVFKLDNTNIINIEAIIYDLYQNDNFIKRSGELFDNNNKNSSITAQNIGIYLGYDISDYQEHTAFLYNIDSRFYSSSSDTKTLQLRWLEDPNDDGIPSQMTVDSFVDRNAGWFKVGNEILEIIKTWPQENQPAINSVTDLMDLGKIDEIKNANDEIKKINDSQEEKYEIISVDQFMIISAHPITITWYKYIPGQPAADPYSGIYWVKLEQFIGESTEKDPFTYIVDGLDTNRSAERFKVIIHIGSELIRSNILEFTNNSVNQDSSSNLNINNIISEHGRAFYLQTTDGSQGRYYLYNLGNSLREESEHKKQRYLHPRLKNSDITEWSSFVWTVPIRNTMINVTPITGIKDKYDVVVNNLDINQQIIQNATESTIVYYKQYIITNISKDSSITPPDLYYTISRTFKEAAANNTIECELRKTELKDFILDVSKLDIEETQENIYYSSQTLSFGIQGNTGTDETFVLDFDSQSLKCLNLSSITEDNAIDYQVTINAYLYDDKNNLINIPSADSIEWICTGDISGEPVGTSYIIHPTVNDTEKTPIVIVTANLKRNDKITLTARIAVPVYINNTGENTLDIDYITGATKVFYSTAGKPDYSNAPYSCQYISSATPPSKEIWQIISNDEENPEDIGLPKLVVKNGKTYLQPTDFFVKDIPECAIQYIALQDPNIVTHIWIQPLLITQNLWFSEAINDWDGNSLSVKTEDGQILGTRFAAGKKDTNNTFTGVLMGDWEKDSTSTTALPSGTGIYGFREGQMAFAFTDDGTGFIGGGGGRINFDGSSGNIISGNTYTENDITKPMLDIDFKNGKITSKEFKIDENGNATFGGYLKAASGSFSGYLDASEGYIGGWTINPNSIQRGKSTLGGSGNLILEGVKIQDGVLSFTDGNYTNTVSLKKTITSDNNTNGALRVDSTAFALHSNGNIWFGAHQDTVGSQMYMGDGSINFTVSSFTWNDNIIATQTWVNNQLGTVVPQIINGYDFATNPPDGYRYVTLMNGVSVEEVATNVIDQEFYRQLLSYKDTIIEWTSNN